MRDEIHDEIEEHGFDHERGTYTQYYGSHGVDASLLQLAQIGYLEPTDPRMLGTVAAIEQDLLHNGLVLRYRSETGVDGLPPGEHPFLACSFWLAEQYARSGRLDDARTLMDTLVGFSNDVGLLSEEYDVAGRHQMGNTPQAFSHLALVRAADAIAYAMDPDTNSSRRMRGPLPPADAVPAGAKCLTPEDGGATFAVASPRPLTIAAAVSSRTRRERSLPERNSCHARCARFHNRCPGAGGGPVCVPVARKRANWATAASQHTAPSVSAQHTAFRLCAVPITDDLDGFQLPTK